jgi:hypothetical protein
MCDRRCPPAPPPDASSERPNIQCVLYAGGWQRDRQRAGADSILISYTIVRKVIYDRGLTKTPPPGPELLVTVWLGLQPLRPGEDLFAAP